jgi:hypothetical protein
MARKRLGRERGEYTTADQLVVLTGSPRVVDTAG